MLKRIIVASALALFSISPAVAGGAATLRTTPGFFAAVQACEAQMQRLAESNKTLAANYNAAMITRHKPDRTATNRRSVPESPPKPTP
jgi:hypothetical protein